MGFLLKRKLDAMMLATIAALLAGDAATQAGLTQWLFSSNALPEWGLQGSAAAVASVLIGRVIYFTRWVIGFAVKTLMFVLAVAGAFYIGKML